ncbi:hypothetical protein [Prochlorococcus marinus]
MPSLRFSPWSEAGCKGLDGLPASFGERDLPGIAMDRFNLLQ